MNLKELIIKNSVNCFFTDANITMYCIRSLYYSYLKLSSLEKHFKGKFKLKCTDYIYNIFLGKDQRVFGTNGKVNIFSKININKLECDENLTIWL